MVVLFCTLFWSHTSEPLRFLILFLQFFPVGWLVGWPFKHEWHLAVETRWFRTRSRCSACDYTLLSGCLARKMLFKQVETDGSGSFLGIKVGHFKVVEHGMFMDVGVISPASASFSCSKQDDGPKEQETGLCFLLNFSDF